MSRFNHKLFILGMLTTCILVFVAGLAAATSYQAKELALASGGAAFEVRRDDKGYLWVSDAGAGEIWQVKPGAAVYTSYAGLDNATDAHADADGDIWWTTFGDNELGHLTPGATSATLWPLTGSSGVASGVAIDDGGIVWSSDEGQPVVHSFDPSKPELCAYTLPDGGKSSYVEASDGKIWLADFVNARILRLNPSNNHVEAWQLGSGSNVFGLTLDDVGYLWWADTGRQELGHLTPGGASYEITTYDVAGFGFVNAEPIMLDYNHGKIWYTDFNMNLFGFLEPNYFSGTSNTAPTVSLSASKQCDGTISGATTAVTTTKPAASWPGNSGYLASLGTNWTMFTLPTGGSPRGIAAADGNVWVVDQDRRQLGWITFDECYFLELDHQGVGGDPEATPTSSTDCREEFYVAGENINLLAKPAAGWLVGRWTGTNDDLSRDLTNSVTMPGKDHVVIVYYGRLPPVGYLPLIVK